jgi:glucose/mannose transport system substrate-binding protein
MRSFSNLDHSRGCKNLTVRSVQSTQLMCSPPLMALAALFALVQAPFFSQAAGEKKLEVFSCWTSGGEAAALDALFTVYNKQYPGVEIVNATVAGGGGFAARPVLHTRLAGGNPPDTWQSHAGWELLGQYVEPGYCEPVTDLYKSEGWDKAFPKALVDLVTKDGDTYAVLAGVHRENVLWYNKKLLDKNGIKVGEKMTFDGFFAACDKIKAAGIPALGVGDSGIWASALLFENTLLGVVGAEGWIDLFSDKMQWSNPKVKEAMKLFAKIIVADGFTLAKGAPHPESALAWLKSIGSKESQEAFNPLKGSIPARIDVDRSKFDAYHPWSMDSFANDRLVPGVVEAAPAAFVQALNDAVGTFIVDKNVDNFANALVQAAKQSAATK